MLREPAEDIVPLGQPHVLTPDHPNGIGIVLVHGFSGSPYQMVNLGSMLVQKGYTVIIPRLPGHASNIEHFRHATVEDWKETVENAVRELTHKQLRVIVIGRSFGGVLGLDAVLSFPNEIIACVCVGTPAPLFPQRLQKIALPLIRLFRSSIKKPWAKPEESEARKQQGRYTELPLVAVAQYLRELCTMTHQRLHQIHVPVLLVHGTSDEAVSPKSLQYYEHALGSAKKRTLEMPSIGHDADQLHASQELQTTLFDFLNTLLR